MSINAYQKDNPPVHQLIAAYLGISSGSKTKKSESDSDFNPSSFFAENNIKESTYQGPRML